MFKIVFKSKQSVTFLEKLSHLLSRRDKSILFLLLGFSVLVSFIETLGLTAVMFFISVTTNFEMVLKNKYCKWFYDLFHCSSAANFIIVLGIILSFFYVFRAVLNIFHAWLMARFAQGKYKQWSQRLFTHYLYFFYKDLVMKNSATVGIIFFGALGQVGQVINALLILFAEFFTILFIYGMMVIVNWKMTCALTLLLAFKGYVLIKMFSNKLAVAGTQCKKFTIEAGKTFNESFGNYKLIKLLGNIKLFDNRFGLATHGIAQAQIFNVTLQNAPRFILETMGCLLLVGIVIYVVYFYGTASTILPVVALYALAFYRILPSVNKILASYNQVLFCKHGVHDVYDFGLHSIEVLGDAKVTFANKITLNDVSFGYKEASFVVKNVSMEILKGERIAFVGESGVGKSTIIDIIMGLYEPQKGKIFIDNTILSLENVKSWRSKIGYIPQAIYLFDGSVADNVIFGRFYDENRLISCLKKANIYDFLLTQDGIHTPVGEGGVRLSGGQKQRVAIARALYADPDVLVLDEATSALDHETESKIMDEIYREHKDKTLIVVAHRLSTVAQCDKVYRIEKGNVFLSHESSVVSDVPKKENTGVA